MGAVAGMLQGLNRGVATAADAVCALLLAVVIVLNASEMALRLFAGTSLAWLYEVNQLLANWIYFGGIIVVYHRGGDIVVRYVRDRLPARMEVPVSVLIDLAGAVAMLLMAWSSVRLMGLQWHVTTAGAGIPNALYTAPLAVSSVAILLILVTSAGVTVLGEGRVVR